MKAWQRVNPAWRVKLWREENIKALWFEKFPQYKDVWGKTKPIQRADIARLMILYVFGGMYADLDCIPSKPIDDIFDAEGFRFIMHDTVVCIEDDKSPVELAHTAHWPIRKGIPEFHRRIANYVMWSKPAAKVIDDALKLAVHRVRTTESMYYHVQGRKG